MMAGSIFGFDIQHLVPIKWTRITPLANTDSQGSTLPKTTRDPVRAGFSLSRVYDPVP